MSVGRHQDAVDSRRIAYAVFILGGCLAPEKTTFILFTSWWVNMVFSDEKNVSADYELASTESGRDVY